MLHQWKADLHTHTHYSDGQESPQALVKQAKAQQIKALGITDHDNVTALAEGTAAGLAEGIEVIPGVELSTQYKDWSDVHLLGYYFDWQDAEFDRRVTEFQTCRVRRGKAILDKVNAQLVAEGRQAISYQDILARITGSFGRPHIAAQLVAQGYVHSHEEAFQQYLIPHNVQRSFLSLPEAIRLIRRARGVPVLAHPTLITRDRRQLQQLIQELTAHGLLGVEAYHNEAGSTDIPYFRNLAQAYNLIYTGGSDYHGGSQRVQLGAGRGIQRIPYTIAVNLKRCFLKTSPCVISLESLSGHRKRRFMEVLTRQYAVLTMSRTEPFLSPGQRLSASVVVDVGTVSPAERGAWYSSLTRQEIPVVVVTESSSSSPRFPTVLWPTTPPLDPYHAPHFVVHQVILAHLRLLPAPAATS